MVELVERRAGGRPLVERYGNGRFTVGGQLFEGSVLVLPSGAFRWPLGEIGQLTLSSLEPILAVREEIDLIVLGCGARMAPLPGALRRELAEKALKIEAMDTGAAARTYNVLATDGRRVAAALIAIP